MSFGRRNLKLKFLRSQVVPEYLHPERDKDVVEDVISFYESNVGRRFGEIDWKLLTYLVGDDRLAAALKHVMRRFYKLERPRTIKADLKDLRAKVFSYVNLHYEGYLKSNLRSEALEEIARKFKVLGDISEILWLDEVENWRLKRERKPSVEDVIGTYNLEVIDTLSTYTIRAHVEYSGSLKDSSMVKVLGRKCKLLGLIYDGRKTLTGKVEFKLSGPQEVFGKPTRYGSRITCILLDLIPYLYSLEEWNVRLKVKFPRRTLEVTILSDRIKPHLNLNLDLKVREAFDSEVEKRIYWTLKSLRLNVVREPEPIVSRDLIFIPDFKVDIGKDQVYIEVVGYWRREYLEKKAYKLMEASKMGVKLVVIADEKARNNLEKLKLPTVYYTIRGGRPTLPYGTLLKIIHNVASR